MSYPVEESVYWLTTINRDESRSLHGEIDVDYAVVGGGFTGLSTAYHLKKAEPSATIALLESEFIGFGASGRNGGFAMTLFGLTMPITALRFGKANAKAAHHYMERSVETTKSLIEDLSLDCDFEYNGFLRVATSPRYEKRIRHDIETAHNLGLEGIEWIGREELAEQIQSPMYRGAWSEARCGILNPAKLARSWKAELESQGIDIYENTPVGEITPGRPYAVLTTPGGRVKAGKVVLATNAYSHLVPQLKWKQLPVWTHIVITEPLSEEQLDTIGWKNRQGVEDARALVHYYRLTADNRLLMGGRDVSLTYGNKMDKDNNDKVFAGLEQDVRELFPGLANVKFTHRWGGPVSVTVDMAPAIGSIGGQIVYSIGCMGHAVSSTHLNGRTIADLVLERETELTDIFFVNRRVPPVPPEPLRSIAGRGFRGYLRLEDKVYERR
jgi:glycine/D-amino acid oxidase-like deaminating enzyme